MGEYVREALLLIGHAWFGSGKQSGQGSLRQAPSPCRSRQRRSKMRTIDNASKAGLVCIDDRYAHVRATF
ncbi:hypothetical protein [Bradyrhizobium sp. RDM4]|uniref:hypothetical protein n=1 Tax=Bradyrhizobium sp. RDM4 TaxID=3378765 RepID=UPI0038FCAC19